MATAPYDLDEMTEYIRNAAVQRGIDPEVALRVARSEGLTPGTWQSNVNLKYGRERSFGPFQLHMAPQGHRGGMGNDFYKQTGLDPSDPSNAYKGVDFALDQAQSSGWGPWFGAKKQGILGMMGIGGNPTDPAITNRIQALRRQPPSPNLALNGMPQGGIFGAIQQAFSPKAAVSPSQATNPMASKLGGVLAALGNLGGGQQAAPPAPAPQVRFAQTSQGAMPRFNYGGGGGGGESPEEKIRRMMMMGMEA